MRVPAPSDGLTAATVAVTREERGDLVALLERVLRLYADSAFAMTVPEKYAALHVVEQLR